MSTHAGAMLIAALAYRYARRNARNKRFTFGTGKMGNLAGFASAVVLALIALLIGWESLMRFYSPVAISFRQAISVAVIGLIVNLICAWLLRDDHAHHHHSHGTVTAMNITITPMITVTIMSTRPIAICVPPTCMSWPMP